MVVVVRCSRRLRLFLLLRSRSDCLGKGKRAGNGPVSIRLSTFKVSWMKSGTVRVRAPVVTIVLRPSPGGASRVTSPSRLVPTLGVRAGARLVSNPDLRNRLSPVSVNVRFPGASNRRMLGRLVSNPPMVVRRLVEALLAGGRPRKVSSKSPSEFRWSRRAANRRAIVNRLR